MNRVGLTAALVEREPIRYTPAGVPIVGLKLSHQSVQREAGADRTVEMEISAIAADRLALRIDRVALGTALKLEGFLAPRRRNVKALVLHVTDFELDTTADRNA
ncbi:MAG: primosomal replication protein N [Burkholderiales bacterium]